MSGTALAIPASAIVNVVPSVISPGGIALDLVGIMLTTSPRPPIGVVPSFPTQSAVAAYFGAASPEASAAATYFLGFDGSNQKPGSMLFAQFNTSAVGGWLRGASLGSMTLTQLQAIGGVLTISINGTPVTSSTINLSAASSFSAAAELITQALGTTGPAGASFTGSISGTTLTVTALGSGTIALGQEVRGGTTSAGTQITAFVSGVGGTGTYTVSAIQTVASAALTSNTPTVTYDSIAGAFFITSATTGAGSTMGYGSGTIAALLGLTLATGATISQGAAPATPVAFMTALTTVTQSWAVFSTMFDPDGGSGNTQKQAFAAWTNASNDNYVYVAWDTDASPSTSNAATSSLGAILMTSNSSGTIPIYVPTATAGITEAAFAMGYIASVDFTETNGRSTAAFKSQSGITPTVTNQTIAANLIANGYDYYGSFATAADEFNFFHPGSISGPFLWIDSYINQIWLTNQFQLALMNLLANAKSIPYNQAGYTLVRAALMDPIKQGLNFGAFVAGVTLSQSQIAEVNSAAGKQIDQILSAQGWYLQILDALPQVRKVRGSPPMTFWYMDGQSIQKITLASVDVQ